MNPLSNKFLFVLITGLFLGSCATRDLDIDYDPIGAQYSIIPETKNELGKPEFGVRSHISNSYDLGGTTQGEDIFSSNPSAVVIRSNEPTQHGGLGFGGFGSLGLMNYVDALAQKSTQGLYQAGLNVCLFINCGYEDKGWKASVYFLGGYQQEDETSTDKWFSADDLEDKDKYANVSGELELKGITTGTTLGYRKADTLYYFNFTYAKLEANSTVTVATQAPIRFEARSETYGALMGWRSYGRLRESGRREFFFLEAGYNQAINRGARRFDRDGFLGSIGLGMAFF